MVLMSSLTGQEKYRGSIRLNSFIGSAWESYNNHRHFDIRPDNVWMAILTQFSLYVTKNSELLRYKFVDFQSKKDLVINTSKPILSAPYDSISIEFTNLISQNIKDPSVKDWLIPNFSTTTNIDKVCYSIALMSTMKSYFTFTMQTKCGLPQVTLHGEPEDWLNLKERASKLIDYNLSQTNEIKIWLDYLLPVLDKFIESINGNPDNQWWNEIVDFKSRSGGSSLSGWLTAFCVFGKKGEKIAYTRPAIKYLSVSPSSIPDGFLSAPIQLIDSDGTRYNSTIYSGQFASKINKVPNSISPSVDWFIIADKEKK